MSQSYEPKRQGVRKSLSITIVMRYSMLVISVVATMVLARLLTPAEIGLFSLATIIVNLAHSLRGFGVGQYIVQETELTTDRIRTAFGITMVIAWVIALGLVAVSPLAADFYGEEGVGRVLRVLALNFALIPFGSVALAMLNREMRFGTIMRISVLSELIRNICSIYLAATGHGYMSLAWGAVAGVVATVILTRLLSPAYINVFPNFKEWRRVLNFGSSATVATIAKDLQDGSPELVIGRAMDTQAVGFFAKAVAVNKLFDRVVLSAVRPALLPHMSAKHRAGESIRDFYTHGLGLITVMAWPFYAFVAVMAFPMVRVLYGDQWDAAAPLARLLCAYAAIDVVSAFAGQALVSVGFVHRLVRLRLLVFAVTLGVVIAAIPYGLDVVALAMTIPAATGLAYSYRLLRSSIGLRFRDYARALGRSALVTALVSAFPLWYVYSVDLDSINVWMTLLLGALGTGISWMLFVTILRHPISGELKLLAIQFKKRIAGKSK